MLSPFRASAVLFLTKRQSEVVRGPDRVAASTVLAIAARLARTLADARSSVELRLADGELALVVRYSPSSPDFSGVGVQLLDLYANADLS
jgi:hypothetical protein